MWSYSEQGKKQNYCYLDAVLNEHDGKIKRGMQFLEHIAINVLTIDKIFKMS